MPIRVLFTSDGPSSRELAAAALLRKEGGPHFQVETAAARPGSMNEWLARLLAHEGIETTDLESSPISRFVGSDFDYVIALRYSEDEDCPTLDGHETIYWTCPNPEHVVNEAERTFAYTEVVRLLRQRISLFVGVNVRASGTAGAATTTAGQPAAEPFRNLAQDRDEVAAAVDRRRL